MSNTATETNTERSQDWLWKIGYAVGNCLQFVVIGLLLDFLLFSGVQIIPFVKFLMLGLLILGIAQKQAWLILVAFQTSLIVRETRTTSLELDFWGFMLAILILIILAYTFQLDRIRDRISSSIANLFISITRGTAESPRNNAVHPGAFANAIGKFGLRICYFSCIVFCGALVIGFLPFSIARQNGLLGESLLQGEIWPGTAVLVFGIGVLLLMREIFWRQSTPEQAAMFLRGSYLREHHREMTSIVWRSLKARQRNMKKKRKKK